ncbi:TonB-dependent hemoglobin/transferrin/lactoferrin family receptor [Rheinheimera sp.]|uniref:TonB-dependent hemoglobin/transferrin/lactoferrin family receptor n=1 Tax=Rheinheimera sp. TaxID=1869214 RepID=UPI00307E1BBE
MLTKKSLLALAISTAVLSPVYAETTPTELEAVTVSADALDSKKSSTAATVVKKADELEKEQAQQLQDLVRYIPGVSLTDQGRFGSSGFNIRGLEGNQVAITVDGLSAGETLNPASYAFYDFFAAGRGGVDPDLVKQIEVVKGADAIAAGSGSLGGAVLFVTKDPADFLTPEGDDAALKLKAAYNGANDELATTLTAAGRAGAWEALLVGTLRNGHEMENYDDSAEKQAMTGSGRPVADPLDNQSHNILAKVKYQASARHELGLTVESYKADTDTNNLSWLSRSYLTRNSDDQVKRQRVGINHQWLAETAWFDSASSSLDFQTTENNAYTLMLAPASTARLCSPGPCYRSEDRDYQQDLTKFAFAFDKELAGEVNQQLLYGGSFEQRSVDFSAIDTSYVGQTDEIARQDIDPDFVPETDADSLAFYLRDHIQFAQSKFSLLTGARYDHVSYSPTVGEGFNDSTGSVRDLSFSALTGQLTGRYQLDAKQRFEAQVGRGFRAPSTEELYFQTANVSRTEQATGVVVDGLNSALSNPDLEAEYSTNLELSYLWQGEQGRVRVGVFHDKYDNLITQVTKVQNPDTVYESCSSFGCTVTQGNPYTINENVGEATVKGLELEGSWRLSPELELRLAYSHLDGEEGNGDPLITASPDNLVLGAQYQLTTWWHLHSNLSYTAKVEAKDAYETDEDGEQTPLVTYLPGSSVVLDLVSNFQIGDSWQASLGVYNLLDREYYRWERIRYAASSRNNISADGIQRYSEPGRTLRASISYSF